MEPYKKWDEGKIEEAKNVFFFGMEKFSSLNSYFYIYKNEKLQRVKKMKRRKIHYLRNLYDAKKI